MKLLSPERHLAWLMLGALLAAMIALVAASPAADALPTSPAVAAAALTTPTPTSTPTATSIPVGPQATDIVCSPTLTASPANAAVLDVVTLTFDDGCVCTGNFACDFFPWNATLTSTGVALVEPFGNPPPASFDVTVVNSGAITATVDYYGERQVGTFYFTSNLTATAEVMVSGDDDPVTPTPTPTATPVSYPYVTCTPSLTASNDTPMIGESVTFTFTSNCTCPTDPALRCYFAQYSLDSVTGDGFDFSAVDLGQGASGPIVGIATAAGSTEVTVQFYGETFNGSNYHWTYQRPSVTVTVENPAAIDFACERQGADLNWTDAGAAKYWIYRTAPNQPDETWIGRTLGSTTFTDPNPVAGANYLVHYAGISRTPCADLGGSVDAAPSVACAVDAGVVTWNDAGQSKYWIYRATHESPTFAWLGRTLGETEFTDPNPVVGGTYQVRFAGAAPFACETETEPEGSLPAFACSVSGDELTWSDHDQRKYWVYRSVDDGQTYTWLGRTLGATSFTDPDPIAGSTYRVHYAGIPRVDCI